MHLTMKQLEWLSKENKLKIKNELRCYYNPNNSFLVVAIRFTRVE